MSWERDPLWAKAKLFFERAFEESPEEPLFGLWCSMGLELLGRAALASVSPTLLAEPDPEHRFLLHALNRGVQKGVRRSIGAVQVFNLCRTLFDGFTEDERAAALALVNRRNDELHTGAASFEEYPSKLWLPGFYRASRSLASAMGESLDTLFGKEEARIAVEILDETQKKVTGHVQGSIAAHRKVFEFKSPEEKEAAAASAKTEAERLAHLRHHKVTCPACGSDATVQGEAFGPRHVTHGDDSITVRQSMSPRSFACPACGLKLQGYAELDAAKLGGQYSRRTEFSPEEFYGLIDPETADLTPYIEAYLADMADEYDNE
jgi:hypothetical protein